MQAHWERPSAFAANVGWTADHYCGIDFEFDDDRRGALIVRVPPVQLSSTSRAAHLLHSEMSRYLGPHHVRGDPGPARAWRHLLAAVAGQLGVGSVFNHLIDPMRA